MSGDRGDQANKSNRSSTRAKGVERASGTPRRGKAANRSDVTPDQARRERHGDTVRSWIQFGASGALVVGVFSFQTFQWHRSLTEANAQWSESLSTSTDQWEESLRTSEEQWRLEGPVIQAVEGVTELSGHTYIEMDFANGTWTQTRAPYTYAYVLSNTGRADATILSASLLDAEGKQTVLPALCAEAGFPVVLPAGASMAIGGRSLGAVYQGGQIRVLLSSGVSQTAQVLQLDNPELDGSAFTTYYREAIKRVTESCDPVDFGFSSPTPDPE